LSWRPLNATLVAGASRNAALDVFEVTQFLPHIAIRNAIACVGTAFRTPI